MCDQTYNGWKGGYCTWVVKLWLDNDEYSQYHWEARAQECLDEETDENVTEQQARDSAAYVLSQELEQDHEDNKPETVGVYADLLGYAMGKVDWYEIAEAYIGDCEYTPPEKDDEPLEERNQGD